MSKVPPRPNCTCIYCGESFSPAELKWRIANDAARHAVDYRGKLYDSLEKVLKRFYCEDIIGQVFLNTVDEHAASREICLVTPADLKPGSSRNLFRLPKNRRIHIFKKPVPQTSEYLHLRFSQDFVNYLDDSGRGIPKTVINKIERDEIHPVCPFCISDLPCELLSQNDSVQVVKLGLIGPAGSGKTSLNMINILFKCLDCGGWKVETKDLYASSHYLLANHYYKPLFDSGKLPPPTPDRYIPPLLLWLEKNGRKVLLLLLDLPASRLKAIHEDLEKHRADHKLAPRTDIYMKLFEQMSGWLLMLDAEQEILPKIRSGGHGEAPENRETLRSLLQIFSQAPELRSKPAALVITKCDLLFTEALSKDEEKRLFETFHHVERALWQMPREDWEKHQNLERQSKKNGFSFSDRHEMIQFSFKPLIQKHFPELAGELEQYFSRVDIFPESNLGPLLRTPNILEKRLDKEWVKPFYSAEPVLRLLDTIL